MPLQHDRRIVRCRTEEAWGYRHGQWPEGFQLRVCWLLCVPWLGVCQGGLLGLPSLFWDLSGSAGDRAGGWPRDKRTQQTNRRQRLVCALQGLHLH